MTHLFDPAPLASAPPGSATGPAEFTAVEGTEHFNGSTLLVDAYAAIWLVLMAWIFLLWRRQGSMAARLDDLERTLDRAAAAAEKKAKAKAS